MRMAMPENPNQQPRCPACRLHLGLCVCHLAPQLALRTRVEVIMHYADAVKMTNSGRLVSLCLPNSAVHIRGLKDMPLAALVCANPASRLVLFPGRDSQELTPQFVATLALPITLLIPDGSWNQARRAVKREPQLQDARRVHLPPGLAAKYRIRAHADENKLCTFEAFSRALGIIESAAVEQQLDDFFNQWVQRVLYTKGQLTKVIFAQRTN
jgi:DTW domain-containing protein YfiP